METVWNKRMKMKKKKELYMQNPMRVEELIEILTKAKGNIWKHTDCAMYTERPLGLGKL